MPMAVMMTMMKNDLCDIILTNERARSLLWRHFSTVMVRRRVRRQTNTFLGSRAHWRNEGIPADPLAREMDLGAERSAEEECTDNIAKRRRSQGNRAT